MYLRCGRDEGATTGTHVPNQIVIPVTLGLGNGQRARGVRVGCPVSCSWALRGDVSASQESHLVASGDSFSPIVDVQCGEDGIGLSFDGSRADEQP